MFQPNIEKTSRTKIRKMRRHYESLFSAAKTTAENLGVDFKTALMIELAVVPVERNRREVEKTKACILQKAQRFGIKEKEKLELLSVLGIKKEEKHVCC